MKVVSCLNYLFSILVLRLTVTTFYAMQPQWHPYEKMGFLAAAFWGVTVGTNALADLVPSLSLMTFVAIVLYASRYFFFFMLAQFSVARIEDMALRWRVTPAEIALAVATTFVLACGVTLPIALSHDAAWCDCKKPTCRVCVFRTKYREWIARRSKQKKSKAVTTVPRRAFV